MTTEIVHLLVPCGKPMVMELPATAAAAAAAERRLGVSLNGSRAPLRSTADVGLRCGAETGVSVVSVRSSRYLAGGPADCGIGNSCRVCVCRVALNFKAPYCGIANSVRLYRSPGSAGWMPACAVPLH